MAEMNKQLRIEQKREGDKLSCKLTGWMDPNTSPDLLNKIDLSGIKSLVLDMGGVEYVFSAGLRSILMLQKLLEFQGGSIKLINLSDDVRSIFECTGLDSLLEPKA
ncbi:MAG: STAS domain-containing protein [Clostridia bacterium]|nr:STAS domain-containing protein [Clostridia bacterium]